MQSPRATFGFGRYPTPVVLLEPLSNSHTALWLKRDDLTHPVYGGSKVRKLEPLLAEAAELGAQKVVTVGAIGSHHVLATGVFGRHVGLEVEAVLLPGPASAAVLETVRASVAQGVRLVPAASYSEAARHLDRAATAGAYAIPAGGTNHLSTLGMIKAATELAEQVRAGLLPEPDLLVLALGSGGTAAGLAAGLARGGLRTRVLAVIVAEPGKVFARKARALARDCVDASLAADVAERLEIDPNYLGEGYGRPTAGSDAATHQAARAGLILDATYTAKAFAAALEHVARRSVQNVLFWHTLSSAPLGPLLVGAPEEHQLPVALRRLAR